MSPHARDIMQRHVVTVDPETSLLDIHRLFVEEEIHGAPVVDDEGRILGVISAFDLLRAVNEERDTVVSDSSYFRDFLPYSGPDWGASPEDFQERLTQRTVSEVMTEGAITVDADASIPEIARTLRSRNVHRVLVVERGLLVGIISAMDLMALLEKEPPGA